MVKHILFAGIELLQLQKEARRSLRSAFAEGTYQNLNIQWVKFLKFCVYFELKPFPASTVVLVWYAQYLTRSLKAHASVVAYLSGIKMLHTLLNFPVSGFHGFLLKLTLRGLRRDNQHIVHRANPITPNILKLIHSKLNHDDAEQAIFWGITILAFLLLFRKSNLVPDTVFRFDGGKQLRHIDVVDDSENSRLVVGIRWAKNHQFTKELLTFPLPELPRSVLCPVAAVRNIRRLVKYSEEDHLFQLPTRGSFTHRHFQNQLRDILKIAGVVDYGGYSSHSLRRGGTTFSLLCGIPTEMIKLLGNWKSDAYLAYLEFPIETRTAAGELIKMRLLAME